MATVAGPLDAAAHAERALRWLDAILARAVARQRAQGRWRGEDDLRGVYVSPELADAVLAGREAGVPATDPPGVELPDDPASPLEAIARCFALDRFERFALLVALAPELDARYRTVFGYLNDDLAQGAPTVAFALDLYGGPGPHTAPLRHAFRTGSPLVRFRLVRLGAPAGSPSLLRCGLHVDEWLVARVAGGDGADAEDPRLVVDAAAAGPPTDAATPWEQPVAIVDADERSALDHAAGILGGPLLRADLRDASDPEDTLLTGARHAALDGLTLVLPGRSLQAAGPAARPSLVVAAEATAAARVAVAVTVAPEHADGLPEAWPRLHPAPVAAPARAERWRTALAGAGVAVCGDAIEAVAASHPIRLGRIDAAVARLAADVRDPAVPLTRAQLQGAARAVARHGLGGLARAVPGGHSWDDLVLSAPALAQLRELAAAVQDRPRVLGEWGFADRPGGHGMHVLFSGPSGTGKTLAASVIAGEAGYALYAVDLAQVVDKYLGETEKQLDRVFDEAAAAGAMLLFDEADALFGRRAEVHDARDRYANVEIAYLLQRLEVHPGVTVLATNLPHHLDQAFARRLHHRVDFAMPDVALRRRLWRSVLPPAAPLDPDLPLDLVAERFELAGGSIRNAALTAAYLAADNGGAIGLPHVVRAIARELQKSGRPATRAEFGDLYGLLAPAALGDG